MTRRMRFLLMLFPLCLSLTLTGCGLQELLGNNTNSSEDQKPVISVSLNEDDPNNILFLKGIEDMAKKENIQIVDLSQATGEKNSSNTETESGKETSYNANAETLYNASLLQGGKVLIYQGGAPMSSSYGTNNLQPIFSPLLKCSFLKIAHGKNSS